MGALEEQDGNVKGVSRPASGPLKCTLLVLAATPLQRTLLNERGLQMYTMFVVYST